jgi:murein L,D-transpeptidase YafK
MTDPVIEVIYVMTHDTWHSGGRRIPVHIFPNRMTDANWARLQRDYRSRPDLITLWRELRPGFLAFESTRRVPSVSVGRDGAYRVRIQE